ncbi:EcoAI/FtnUII family type I restriction enzme subunit R [Sulfurimonas microaerophilic]|uniref:EcoAI/FtnUII family type I restriction enzme subunit R n=1 Tax=Sulfurimonas microaerophilic TaxID=3058392 RepID=UPI00271475B7|nr:type I restriction endonuclease subunit R [Sulfurimonas sp. hsl 1-7]
MNEAQTRLELIDPKLREAGWGVVEDSRIQVEYPISQGRLKGYNGERTNPIRADYVLVYKNRRLAVIEAKKRDLHYSEGVAQAKEYADRLQIRYAYSTNGLAIYGIDMDEATEGDVKNFPTPNELWQMTYPKEDSVLDRLFAIPLESSGGKWQLRYYQTNAINRVLEAVANEQKHILLTLATGTGKTAIAFQIAWKLFHSRWNLQKDFKRTPRILFLADRNILADQAFNSFGAFEEDALVRINPSEIRKKNKVPKNGSIFFTIFQTFMTGINDTPNFGEYPKDYFDFIIIDECHRGGANDESEWRAILEYFSPAYQLGLTATPKRDVNGDTYAYFGKPVYEYSLKEGINDGFLTPFKVKDISTTGDTYIYTDEDEILEGEIEEGREYTKEEQNRIIEIMDIEKYRVKLFMDMIDQTQKTLVFCETQAHAAAIRNLINQSVKEKHIDYCHRVGADDGARGEKHLRDFQDNEKRYPTILTTSRKLSTGVDAPEIKNIVLLRSVKSMVEFKQIIGRGTRLFDGKDYFTIYDFYDAYKHFHDPKWDGEPIDPETPKPKPPKEPCKVCGERPCICPPPEEQPCKVCGNIPCVCEKPPKQIIKIKLSDGNYRNLDSMVKTMFYSPEGKPISAGEFVKRLFDDMPNFFEDEDELRRIWSIPDTRKRLLEELSDAGYSVEQLEDLKAIVHGEDSDLYDVLSYIAYHKDLIPRLDRATKAKLKITHYDKAKQDFLDFVLEQYVDNGVKELDDKRLATLLVTKYHAIDDAKQVLGEIPEIRETFIGFQKYLYEMEIA